MSLPVKTAVADNSLAESLDAVIDRTISDKRLVGAVVLVARDGQIVYRPRKVSKGGGFRPAFRTSPA